MYLHKSERKGRTYLSIVEGYREGGKVKHRTVESLGYVDDLMDEYGPDPVAHFKQACKERTAAKEAEAQAVTIEIHPSEKVDKRADGRKNIGAAVLLAAYNLLGVERAVRNACRGRRLGFDCNAAMRLLVADRLFDRGSKLSAWENRGKWFFESKLSDDDVYRALDELAACRDRIVSAMNRAVADGPARARRQRVLRRHQLLLRGGRARRAAPQGRLQGAPPGPDRADGPAAGQRTACP